MSPALMVLILESMTLGFFCFPAPQVKNTEWISGQMFFRLLIEMFQFLYSSIVFVYDD